MIFYEHRQKGGHGFYFCGFITLISIAAVCYILAKVKSPDGVYLSLILAFAAATLIWSTLLLFSLTVSIDNEFIRVVFGPHAFFKKFALKDITACKPVKNSFCDGWGIHMCGNGWLYNIAGFDAVEITTVSGKQHRIGTDEPYQLAEAIQNTIDKFSKGDK